MEQKTRIALIDDEEIVLKRLKPALEKSGYEVEVFPDGESALERMQEAHFQVLVTDIRMTGMSGIQVLEHVFQSYPETRVIIISGYATLETAREALAKGAFDFIAKPFRPNDLRAIIAKAVKSLEGSG